MQLCVVSPSPCLAWMGGRAAGADAYSIVFLPALVWMHGKNRGCSCASYRPPPALRGWAGGPQVQMRIVSSFSLRLRGFTERIADAVVCRIALPLPCVDGRKEPRMQLCVVSPFPTGLRGWAGGPQVQMHIVSSFSLRSRGFTERTAGAVVRRIAFLPCLAWMGGRAAGADAYSIVFFPALAWIYGKNRFVHAGSSASGSSNSLRLPGAQTRAWPARRPLPSRTPPAADGARLWRSPPHGRCAPHESPIVPHRYCTPGKSHAPPGCQTRVLSRLRASPAPTTLASLCGRRCIQPAP